MKGKIHYLLFLFFLASMLGWVGEIIYRFFMVQRIVNPGTLSGPWCPIYGTAIVFIYLFTKKKDSLLKNFIKMVGISTVVEYISAFISEEFFHHKIWDYSNYFLNFQGRVCLQMSLLFGFISMICIYFVLPKVEKIYQKYMQEIVRLDRILLFLFLFNIVFQSFCMNRF